MRKTLLSAFVVSCFAFVQLGCGEADRAIDCAQICKKFDDCFGDSNSEDCVDRCEDKADADADFEEKVDDCENCLDDTSCSEATVGCTDECAVIIAEST